MKNVLLETILFLLMWSPLVVLGGATQGNTKGLQELDVLPPKTFGLKRNSRYHNNHLSFERGLEKIPLSSSSSASISKSIRSGGGGGRGSAAAAAAAAAAVTAANQADKSNGNTQNLLALRKVALFKSLKSMIGFTVAFVLLIVAPAYGLSVDNNNWKWSRGWTYIASWAILHLLVNLPMAYYYPSQYIMREGPSFTPDQPARDKIPTALFHVSIVLTYLLAPLNTFWLQDTALLKRFTAPLPKTIIPPWLCSLVGWMINSIGYILFHVVPIQNQYARKNLAPQTNQQIVDTGLYGTIRHPMYFGLCLWQIGLSLYFGSWPSFAMVPIITIPALFLRISLEEEQLLESQPTYKDYMKRVPYRFIPFIL